MVDSAAGNDHEADIENTGDRRALERVMLFSRLSENIRKQDWFTVCLEIFAVVFGVLLALQVNNWNEWRVERIEERKYILRLHADIDQSINTSRAAIAFMENHAARATVVLRSLDACSIETDDQLDFANGLFQLGKIVPPYLADGTLQEMLSTGKMTVIQSLKLREEINNLLSQRRYVLSFYNSLMDRVTSHQVYVDTGVRYFQPEGQEIRFENLRFDLETICQDRRFYNSVSASQSLTFDAIYWNRMNINALESAAELISSEFERLGIESPQ